MRAEWEWSRSNSRASQVMMQSRVASAHRVGALVGNEQVRALLFVDCYAHIVPDVAVRFEVLFGSTAHIVAYIVVEIEVGAQVGLAAAHGQAWLLLLRLVMMKGDLLRR